MAHVMGNKKQAEGVFIWCRRTLCLIRRGTAGRKIQAMVTHDVTYYGWFVCDVKRGQGGLELFPQHYCSHYPSVFVSPRIGGIWADFVKVSRDFSRMCKNLFFAFDFASFTVVS